MKIQTRKKHVTFSGYDARKIKAFVMNSNYADIANEMKAIGKTENFDVLLLENGRDGFTLKNDSFEHSEENKGVWAQDMWGIVNNTMLARDNLDPKSQVWQMLLGLVPNKTQLQKQEKSGLNKLSQFVDLLYNFPVIEKDGKEFVQLPALDGESMEVEKSVHEEHLQLKIDQLKELSNQCHIKGGNYFITKGADGKDELLIGQDELKKFDIQELKTMFNTEKVIVIPQADYHLDLFIRPLNDKKVLIADDEMMSKILTDGFNKIKEMIVSKPQNEREQYKDVFVKLGTYEQAFKNIIEKNPLPKADEVEKALIEGGYEPIRVPGRLYELWLDECYFLRQMHNYINANVLVNDKNEVVYITNKSTLDENLGLTKEIQKEIGFSFEQSFKDAIAPYVDKVYFVSGKDNAIGKEMLPEYFGGIHCMTMEVPFRK